MLELTPNPPATVNAALVGVTAGLVVYIDTFEFNELNLATKFELVNPPAVMPTSLVADRYKLPPLAAVYESYANNIKLAEFDDAIPVTTLLTMLAAVTCNCAPPAGFKFVIPKIEVAATLVTT